MFWSYELVLLPVTASLEQMWRYCRISRHSRRDINREEEHQLDNPPEIA